MKKNTCVHAVAGALFSLLLLLSPYGGSEIQAKGNGEEPPARPSANVTVEEIVLNMKNSVEGIATFRGIMEAEVLLAEGPVTQEYRIWYGSGNRSRLEWTSPDGGAMTRVCDGITTWFHVAVENKLYVQKTLEGDLVLELFEMLRDPRAHHDIAYIGAGHSGGRKSHLLKVEPRNIRTNARTTWHVDGATWFLLATESDVDGIHNRVNFRDSEFNPDLDPSTFEFMPPEGVQVIDFDAIPDS